MMLSLYTVASYTIFLPLIVPKTCGLSWLEVMSAMSQADTIMSSGGFIYSPATCGAVRLIDLMISLFLKGSMVGGGIGVNFSPKAYKASSTLTDLGIGVWVGGISR